MLLIQHRAPNATHHDERLVLAFDLRQKSRLRTQSERGEDVGLFLEHGSVLRDGDLLQADDGRIVRVVAQAEAVYRLTCASPRALTHVAYHLGNRHVPVQIGENWLRIERDHVLKDMVQGLGAVVVEEMAAFEPESGAYKRHQHALRAEA